VYPEPGLDVVLPGPTPALAVLQVGVTKVREHVEVFARVTVAL